MVRVRYIPADICRINLYLEHAEEDDLDERLNNLNNFYYWFSSRVLSLDRKYAKEILNSIGAKQAVTDRDRARITISYHCLSLMDVFWVKQNREPVTFSDLSLFRNSLSGAFADVSLNGRQLTVQHSEMLRPQDATGDVSTSGVAPKAWIREKDTFYLLKNGEDRDVQAEGLNQIEEVQPEWFTNVGIRNMFFKRLELLKNAEKKR